VIEPGVRSQKAVVGAVHHPSSDFESNLPAVLDTTCLAAHVGDHAHHLPPHPLRVTRRRTAAALSRDRIVRRVVDGTRAGSANKMAYFGYYDDDGEYQPLNDVEATQGQEDGAAPRDVDQAPDAEAVADTNRVAQAEGLANTEPVPQQERVAHAEPITGPEHPPEDIAQFDANAAPDVLVAEIRRLSGEHDRATFAGFCCRWGSIPRLYALKCNAESHEQFVAGCHECGIGYSMAQQIIRHRLPERAEEIWRRVMAEANSAHAQGKWYEYPSFSKMVGWYRQGPPPTVNDNGGGEDGDDEGTGGGNRTKRQLLADNLHLEDENKKLTRRVHKAEQAAAEARERDDRHWLLARERQQTIDTIRAELVAAMREVAALREQMDALRPMCRLRHRPMCLSPKTCPRRVRHPSRPALRW
jgi:hypothetical protein